jgi:hypothetical protein
MALKKRTAFSRLSVLFMLAVGGLTIGISAFYVSSFLAIVGTAFLFWGVVLFYLMPERHVPLAFVDALTNDSYHNTELILSEFGMFEKGIYLPPRNLKEIESSLVFIPKTSVTLLPIQGDADEKLFSTDNAGLFLSPPGYGLSKLLTKQSKLSFTKINLNQLALTLPRLLVEDLKIAEKVNINSHDSLVTIEIFGSILANNCENANNYPHTHSQIGCTLTSALACILAKTTGNPVIIQSESHQTDADVTTVTFVIKEDELSNKQ